MKFKIINQVIINSFLLVLLSALYIQCNRVEKVVNEVKSLQQVKISYDDYDVEIDQYKRSIYVDKNRNFMTGHYFVFYKEKVSEEFIVKGGVLDGYHRIYQSVEGYLSKEMPYNNGYLDGVQKTFNKDGRVTGTSTYKMGKRIGDAVGYNNNEEMVSKTETIDGKAYKHSYWNNKLKMTTYDDNIDGKSYTIMLSYDAIEMLQGAYAIKENDKNNGIPAKLYILNDQYKIVDSISPAEEPERMMEIFGMMKP